MSEMTREQAYRRWKKGEDPHKLAKEKGVTRERMHHILKKMDASVPLVDRIEELEAKLDEAVFVLQICCNFMEYGTWPDRDPVVLAQKTIAKLKGQDDAVLHGD